MPSYHRRAFWHDYRRPGIYMLTIGKAFGVGAFSEICIGPDGNISTSLFPIGTIIEREIRRLPSLAPGITTYRHVVMPDHIHILLEVTRPLPRPLGNIIASFKGRCTSAALTDAANSLTHAPTPSVFNAGYHDRIIFSHAQLHTVRSYIADNPRRLWFKRQHPQWLSTRYCLSINGDKYHAIGNIYLLRDFCILPVRISRHTTPDEIRQISESFRRHILNGAVIASPFISRGEKAIFHMALENQGKIIQLLGNGFPSRYKPSGRLFDYSLTGRLLQIAPTEYTTTATELSRTQALKLNAAAEAIARNEASLAPE